MDKQTRIYNEICKLILDARTSAREYVREYATADEDEKKLTEICEKVWKLAGELTK